MRLIFLGSSQFFQVYVVSSDCYRDRSGDIRLAARRSVFRRYDRYAPRRTGFLQFDLCIQAAFADSVAVQPQHVGR